MLRLSRGENLLLSFATYTGLGTIFRAGGRASKSGEKQKLSAIGIFRKRYMRCTMGSGAKRQKLENVC